MGAVFEDEAGGLQVRALHNLYHLGDVLVVQRLKDVILSLYFLFVDGNQHLDGHSLPCPFVRAIQNMRIPPSP